MWLNAAYQSVSLFSLKVSTATSSGGKTLLAPTPYAIKMAMLDAACRIQGVGNAEQLWPDIRDAQVALRLASYVVVTNLFQKIQKPARADGGKSDETFRPTIGYREYAQMTGDLGIAILVREELQSMFESLMLNISYIGKRGGFFQLVKPVEALAVLPDDFVSLTETQIGFPIDGVMQVMDDCTPALSFTKVDIYSGKRVVIGKERIQRNIVLPYRRKRSSRSFTLYERI